MLVKFLFKSYPMKLFDEKLSDEIADERKYT